MTNLVALSSKRLARCLPFDRRLERVMLLGILPAWGVAGIFDWWFHRRSHIEEPQNGGLRESLFHSLMLAEGGIPIGLAVLSEINPLSLAIMMSASLAHELTANIDLQVATRSDREVVPIEQQVHSFLETLPFFLVAISAAHAWPVVKTEWVERSSWTLRRKESPVPAPWLIAGAVWMTLSALLPYAEEAARCARGAARATKS